MKEGMEVKEKVSVKFSTTEDKKETVEEETNQNKKEKKDG